MAQLGAVHGLGQQEQKGFEVVGLKHLAGHELPDDGTELVTELAADKMRDGLAGVGEHPAIRGATAGLEREHNIIGRFVVPF